MNTLRESTNIAVQFIEDEGSVVFYKNAQGLAATRPVFRDNKASDSGVEVEN